MNYVVLTLEYIKWRLGNLSASSRKVEEILWMYMNFQSCTSHPSQAEVANQGNLSRSTVVRALKELEKKHIIRKTHKKSGGKKQYFYNEYFILNYSKNKLVVPELMLTDNELDDIIDSYLSSKGL